MFERYGRTCLRSRQSRVPVVHCRANNVQNMKQFVGHCCKLLIYWEF